MKQTSTHSSKDNHPGTHRHKRAHPVKTTLLHYVLYHASRRLAWLFFKVGWRLSVQGDQHLPSHGPVIIAANHRSFADPPVLGVSVTREVHFLAKEELFRFRPFGWLIGQLNAHPLNRYQDVGAFRAAMTILEHDFALIVFPEGTRSRTDKFGRAKAGVGMLAKMADCPVLPAYIHNTGYMKKFKKISVRFGSLLHPNHYDSYQALAEAVMSKIQELKEQTLKEIH